MCRPLDDRRQEMQLAAAGDMSDEAVTAVSQGERAARPVVEISNLSKSFSGTLALASFDLAIAPGEVHVLVGANGSGKSTLIKVLSGFHSPDEGEVLIGGHPLPFSYGGHSYRLGCRSCTRISAWWDRCRYRTTCTWVASPPRLAASAAAG